VKKISRSVSFNVMSIETRVLAKPSAIARTIAIKQPPTTGAGTLNRSSQATRLTSSRPAKSTTIATRSVQSRLNSSFTGSFP
jgi:hypothetical protein